VKLFVYGTLQFPEILRALLNEVPNMTPARLGGYRAASLKNRMFPGLVKSDNSIVDGFVLDLTRKQYDVIAAWEDEKYIKHYFESKEITVTTERSAEALLAFMWNEPKLVLSENWDKEKFYSENLETYIARIGKYLSEL
jgi:gamma-glutamylcyclotransferase (GGCT)/AIG2-like uncharacterized protein YtfP